MRRIPLVVLAVFVLGGALAGCSETSAKGAFAEADDDDRLRTAERLIAVLDYVASDYRAAVPATGQVVDADEYQEQIGMVASAMRFADALPRTPRAALDELDALVRAKAAPDEVARRCAAIRARVVEVHAVATAPAVPPSLERGTALFGSACVQCHGASGRGDGPEAARHDPRPADLLDPERMAAVTPYRAYCDVTYGIAGTAMPALAVSAADRWSVAFYACALRHLDAARASSSPPEGEGVAHADATPPAPAPRIGLATLAASTDAELLALLGKTIADPAARRVELARQRALAPFAPAVGAASIAYARRAIAEGREAALAGRRPEADALVLDAYLRGIEEIEAPLLARDGALVDRLERAVGALRAAIATGAPADVDDRAAELLAALDRAERLVAERPLGAGALFANAALLIVREGLEAALIIAAILAVVRRMGLPPSAARAVHAGWVSALAMGLATFLLARTALARAGLDSELVEGAVSLLAAAVLFGTSFWLISKADARRWIAYVKERAQGSAARGGLLGLFSIAFLAAYREAFETVLFYAALAGGNPGAALPLAGGTLAGALVLAAAVLAISRGERRLPIGPFFAASGALLLLLSVVLLGHGVHALEKSRLLLPRPVAFAEVPWLGVYPDAFSLAAQGALLAVIAAAALAMKVRGAPRAYHEGRGEDARNCSARSAVAGRAPVAAQRGGSPRDSLPRGGGAAPMDN